MPECERTHQQTHMVTLLTLVQVIMDISTGRSKGYGFVRFMTEQERDQAIGQMNGTFLSSKTIRVCEATSKQKTSAQSAGLLHLCHL